MIFHTWLDLDSEDRLWFCVVSLRNYELWMGGVGFGSCLRSFNFLARLDDCGLILGKS